MPRLPIAICLASLSALMAGCRPYYVIDMATPIRPKLDVSRFDRVLVAGFVVNGGDPIDTDAEMRQLLRSQLRNKAMLTVSDGAAAPVDQLQVQDAAHWRRVGEEHPRALIVTGSVSFAGQVETQVVKTDQRRSRAAATPQRPMAVATVDQQHYTLQAVFVFIDGDTGATLHVRPFRLETRYDAFQSVPPLSAFFDLMDRLLPNFLNIVSEQTFHGTRTLLK